MIIMNGFEADNYLNEQLKWEMIGAKKKRRNS